MMQRMALGSVVFGIAIVASIPADALTFVGVQVGDLLYDNQIDAVGYSSYTVNQLRPRSDVIVVVTGTFVYSRDGRQDAHYRWHLGKNDRHSPCDLHASKGRDYAFLIDDRCWSPAYWDFDKHTYVYFFKIGPSGRMMFKINDNKYGDNRRGLRVRIYTPPY